MLQWLAHGILLGPAPCSCFVFATVCLVHVRDFWHQRVIRVWVRQQGTYGQQNLTQIRNNISKQPYSLQFIYIIMYCFEYIKFNNNEQQLKRSIKAKSKCELKSANNLWPNCQGSPKTKHGFVTYKNLILVVQYKLLRLLKPLFCKVDNEFIYQCDLL